MPDVMGKTAATVLGPSSNQVAGNTACCCDKCDEVPSTITIALSGFNPNGCVASQFESAEGVGSMDGVYTLTESGGGWTITNPFTGASWNAFTPTMPPCSGTPTPGSLYGCEIAVGCFSSMFSVSIIIKWGLGGNADLQQWSGTVAVSNGASVSVVTPMPETILFTQGTATISW